MSTFNGPYVIVPAAANNMTGTAAITSIVMDMRTMPIGAIQAIWTGTPTGVFVVKGSLDYKPNPAGGVLVAGTWDPLSVSLSAPAGAAGHSSLDIGLTGFPFLQVVYTNATGTGALSVMAFSKG